MGGISAITLLSNRKEEGKKVASAECRRIDSNGGRFYILNHIPTYEPISARGSDFDLFVVGTADNNNSRSHVGCRFYCYQTVPVPPTNQHTKGFP